MPSLNTVIMVPRGAEFKAVQRGLQSAFSVTTEMNSLKVLSLPVGPIPVKAFLSQWCKETNDVTEASVVLMGLCGSLTPHLKVNNVVIYERCTNGISGQPQQTLHCSNDVSVGSTKISFSPVTLVTGVMCDRVIALAKEKRQLAEQYKAEVVDMEGFAALEVLHHHVQSVSMLRVISDDASHDVPNLNNAFDSEGNIKPWIMARQFLLQPRGAVRLIKGSLSALKQLEKLAHALGTQYVSQ